MFQIVTLQKIINSFVFPSPCELTKKEILIQIEFIMEMLYCWKEGYKIRNV